MDNDMLKMPEVCKLLKVSRQQVGEYIKRGVLHSVQYVPGGDHRFKKEEVLQLLQSKTLPQ